MNTMFSKISFVALLSLLVLASSNVHFLAVLQDDEEPAHMRGMTERHNYWRSELGLPPLKWSNKLAKVAQEWANELKSRGCKMEHSNTSYGENIYWAWGSEKRKPQDAVDAWASEKKDFDFETLQCKKSWSYCGHYTQLIWEDTKEVGCGVAYCSNGSEIWVCNYSPAGNVVGQKPYKKKK